VGKRRPDGLSLRLGSGFILIVLALLIAWLGGVAFATLVAVGLALVVIESNSALRMREAPHSALVMITGLAALGGALALAALSWYWLGVIVAAAGGAVVIALGFNRRRRADAVIQGGIVAWAAVAGMALLWLRETGGWGAVFWLFAVLWATDSGAYALGRLVGGARLSPRLSPNKTWAGALGGGAAGVGVGAGAGWVLAALGGFSAPPALGFALGAAALLSVLGQMGDLAESAFKRRCAIKDSGNLIPGHGGAFDRLDSLLAATPAFAVLLWALEPSIWQAP
jgi:phosphatidate cytidylyltransferase